jgi:hypothetical protein
MILPLPKSFDSNEWFIIGASIVAWGCAFPLVRRQQPLLVLGIWLFNFLLAQMADFTLAVKPFDLYNINDRKEYGLFDLILYMVTYPPVGMLAAALPSRLRMNAAQTTVFILAASALTVGLEYAAHLAGVYHYHGWKLIYSYPSYIVSFLLNLWFYRYITRNLPASAAASSSYRDRAE